MDFKPAKIKEKWNSFVVAHDGSFLQTWEWGEFRKFEGIDVKRFWIYDGKVRVGAVQLEVRPLKLGKTYFYISRGPVLAKPSKTRVQEVLKGLTAFIKDHTKHDLFARLDIPHYDISIAKTKEALNSIEAIDLDDQVEPRYTREIDLTIDEEMLGVNRKKRAKTNMNRAHKFEIEVERLPIKDTALSATSEGFEKGFEAFWKLMKSTSERTKTKIHKRNYYLEFFKHMSPYVRLYIARHEGKPVVANVVLWVGKKAHYIYGATDVSDRDLGASYLSQWKQIMDAKNSKLCIYDIGGVAHEGKPAGWVGFTFFKESFGGSLVEYPGAWDYVYNKPWYAMYRLATKMKS